MAIRVPISLTCDHRQFNYKTKEYDSCDRKMQVEADISSEGHIDLNSIDSAVWRKDWYHERSHYGNTSGWVYCPEHKDKEQDR